MTVNIKNKQSSTQNVTCTKYTVILLGTDKFLANEYIIINLHQPDSNAIIIFNKEKQKYWFILSKNYPKIIKNTALFKHLYTQLQRLPFGENLKTIQKPTC